MRYRADDPSFRNTLFRTCINKKNQKSLFRDFFLCFFNTLLEKVYYGSYIL